MKKKTIWDLHRISPEEFKASEKLPLVMVLDNAGKENFEKLYVKYMNLEEN